MNKFCRISKMAKRSIVALALLTSVANAEDLISATDVNKILNIAKGYGSARLTKDSSGDPLIKGKINGIAYSLYFENCDDECTVVQFYAGWADVEVSQDRLNTWNRDKIFGKAYQDEDGDPVLEMSVNLDYGVTVDNFDDTFDYWKLILQSFESTVIP